MRRRMLTTLLSALVLFLVFANVKLATAHWWETAWTYYHFHKSTINLWIYGSHQAQAEAARLDWHNNTDLSLPRVNFHTDVSVFGANSGATGWGGLASLEDTSWYWHCGWWCGISHAHSQYNSYYGSTNLYFVQGIFCQEIGHTFGLAHPWIGDAGGCMGYTYDSSSNVTSPHNRSEINAQY